NTGAVVNLDAGGVAEASGATITGTTLHLSGAGTFALPNNNAVDAVSASITGRLEYFDVDALTVGNGGISSGGGDVTLAIGALDLALADSIAASAGAVRLQAAGGAITQSSGSVTAGALGLRAAGAI